MKKLQFLLLLIPLFISISTRAQKVHGTVSTKDTARLAIMNIYPNKFPTVDVVFKAENRKGEPIWNLKKEDMIVKEGENICKVISLEPLSKSKPINVGVVLDHSGSMGIGYIIRKDSSVSFLIGQNSPMELAKKSVKSFIGTFNFKKDYISLIAFTNSVDINIPKTQNTKLLIETIDTIQPTYSTALYVAMIAGLKEISNGDGVNVLVVLTDGMDNMSEMSNINEKDVIRLAKKLDIPVFIIGLGNVNKNILQKISNSTKGQSYFTNSANSLNDIYADISKKVQAYYSLVYESDNLSSMDSTRTLELSFEIDSLYLETSSERFNVPKEVREILKEKETEKEYLVYGGILAAILLVGGVLIYTYTKKRKVNINNPKILKIYPNPSDGNITIDYESTAGQIHILNLQGQIAKTMTVDGITKQFDFTDLTSGNYVVFLESNGLKSNTVQLIIK